MRRTLTRLSPFVLILLLLSGCSSTGDKSAGATAIYGTTAVLSTVILVGYCCVAKKKNTWYLLLFSSIIVVNIGYLALAISKGLDEALLANRVSYLGSVFLPLSMCMIILNSTHIRYPKWLSGALLALAGVMFLIAASPGYLPIYYKSVSFAIVHGTSTLIKEYGPLHSLYLVYLVGYFGSMIAIIIYATIRNKIDSPAYAVMIAIAVFVNLGVWLMEQFVSIDFEILSVSYIISECFLLGLHFLMVEAEKHRALSQMTDAPQQVPPQQEPLQQVPLQQEAPVSYPKDQEDVHSIPQQDTAEATEMFLAGLAHLTPKERQIYDCYISGLTTDVIMETLCIKENTLKFHNKNLYSKLGVKSRKQLVELHKMVSAKDLVHP